MATNWRIVSVSHARQGQVWLDAQGIVHFRPEPDYFGPASFSYTVSDGRAQCTGAGHAHDRPGQ